MVNRYFDFADEAGLLDSNIIHHRVKKYKGIKATWMELKQDDHEKGKQKGNYISIETQDLDDKEQNQYFEQAMQDILQRLLKKYHYTKKSRVLCVGLGNDAFLSDALGPKTMQKLHVTSHLVSHSIFSSLVSISSFRPGVMSSTGMETSHLIRAIQKGEKFDIIVVIDSLATTSLARLYKVVQISDTGIHPGSGVANHRLPIDSKTMGCPVICIGVATVVESASLVFDTLQQMIPLQNVPYQKIREILHEKENNFVMTSKDIDRTIERLSSLLAHMLNSFFNPILLD